MKRNWKRLLLGYLAALGASQLYLGLRGENDSVESETSVETPDGVLAYHEWGEREGVPLILSHGSPSGGGGGDFEEFAIELAKERWVIAPDRLGFGRSSKSAKDLSFLADASSTFVLMDELGIETADVMGWSYGGGVVLEMASRRPERVRSVGLLGAIGIQEGEGSGSYWVEHLKYKALWGALVALPEVIPHFGLAGPRWFRRSFVKDFADADQRPLRGIMKSLKQPVLIVHGKDDPLVPAWAAEEHHELLGQSRLEILAGSHFFPAGGEGMESAAKAVEGFLGEVSEERVVSGSRYETKRKNMKALWEGGPEVRGWKPWWLVMGLSAALAWWRPRLTLFIVALGGGLLMWDAVIGFVAVFGALGGRKFFGKPLEKPRSRWFPMHLFFDLVAGSLIGGMLLAAL
ncbi:MAG: alpha/beta fold hydrolase [Roseibacillus sp.]